MGNKPQYGRPMTATERARLRRKGVSPDEYERFISSKEETFRNALENGNHFLAIQLYNKALKAAGYRA